MTRLGRINQSSLFGPGAVPVVTQLYSPADRFSRWIHLSTRPADARDCWSAQFDLDGPTWHALAYG